MRIRSLEITGFKSFADRTVLAFDQGISAIVGPNGCGKSNVVDALRWVMGELNPRLLRGRLMEDVIFSGTESRPPVGMAEVVLRLDSSDGIGPAQYSGFTEIQVARRLYRSGESEYLINKVACRLRDVLDFFLDTGIGARGYTIVEQGQIATIVSTRAADRRLLLEEAAGIEKYRQRRQETERKLEATEQNLLRVSDILGELRRQISSLERQARKARHHRELSARIRDLELLVTWEEHRAGTRRLAEVEREHENLRAAAVAVDARVGRSEADLEAERRRHLDLEKGLQRTSESLYAVRSEIQALENRVEYERRERDGLARLASQREAELGEIESQLDADCAALTEALEALACLEERLAAEQSQIEVRGQVLQEESERLSSLQGRREAMQARMVRLSAEAATCASRVEALDERRRELEVRLRESQERLDAVTVACREHQRREAAMEAGLRESLAEKDGLGHRLADVLREHQDGVRRVEELRRDLGAAREQMQQVRARLESLRDAERLEVARLSEILERMPPEHRQRVRGILAEVMQVEQGFEAAVEAVLAGRLGAVLVDDWSGALELLGWFREESVGRATLLPLSRAQEGSAGFVPLGRPLLDVVTPAPPFRALVGRLLRDVYLVDDLGEPVRRFGIESPPAVFVTPQGELLERSGALTGGRRVPPGAFSRAGEIRGLEEEFGALEARSADLAASASRESERVAGLFSEVENVRSRHHTAELAVANLEKDLERVRERAKEAAERLQDGWELKQDLAARMQRVGHEEAEIQVRLGAMESERTKVESGRSEISVEISELGREIGKLDRHLVQCRVELAELGARRTQLVETRDRLQVAVREAGEWIDRRREEIQGARQRGEELGRSSEEASASLVGRIEEEERLRARQESLREGCEAGQQELEQLQVVVRAGASEREALREKLGASELALQEARLEGTRLAERILERYGVDLASYQPPAGSLGGDRELRQAELRRIRAGLESLGDVHLGAIEEYEEVSERHRYLTEQKADLELSVERLRRGIARINRTSRARFRETFEQVNREFQQVFPRLFGGGRAHLSLTEAEDLLEAGVEITVQPSGKKLQNVNLLSGGEKSLTALALLMAVFRVRPSPFFLLDEVDAALDEANVDRFNGLLREMAAGSQFLLITHNKGTIEIADVLFGVTMQEPGLSKLVTVDLVS